MNAYTQLVWAQLLLFARNKNVMIWSLFLPVFMMFALGTLIGDNGNQFSLSLGVADQDRTPASSRFISSVKQLKGMHVVDGTEQKGKQDLKRGQADILLVIKRGFSAQLASGEPAGAAKQISIYYDPAQQATASIGLSLLEQVIDQYNKERVGFKPVIQAERITVNSHPLSYVDFLVPGILSLMIMSTNLNGVAGTISSWRERGILRRMQGTPLSSATFIAGQMTARILFNTVQALVVLLVAYLAFDVHVYGAWWVLILFILLGTFTFMSIGFIVASLAKTPESASPIAGLISFPMMFVGGIFFPIRELPELLQPLVKAIPIGYLTDALRGVMNEGMDLGDLSTPLLVLLAWAVGSFIVAAATFRWDVK
ncbi:ABC transporter permease [Laceyella putida]|jgi:ABC-2 type transport system permease protein|uniref:ABC transporter permease n=1 Tax=Laceyella putida TaxID=110101 RepID=A0ABW2RKN0_9BACL